MQLVSEHRFTSLADARAYALAGNATLTLQSLKTGAHFTYKVRAPKEQREGEDIRFVKLLTSGNVEEGEFTYLGLIGKDGNFHLTKKSCAGADAPSAKAWSFFWALRDLPSNLVVFHSGTCGRCGRTLTVPESIQNGIGPECLGKMWLD